MIIIHASAMSSGKGTEGMRHKDEQTLLTWQLLLTAFVHTKKLESTAWLFTATVVNNFELNCALIYFNVIAIVVVTALQAFTFLSLSRLPSHICEN
jgi:hypothetical protein